MPRQDSQHDSDAVVAAINRVLRTERDGIETLRRAGDDARRRQSDARAQAAAIASRADACITRLHAAYLRKIEQDIQALDVSDLPGDGGRSHAHAALAKAARRVAAKLTGGA